MSDTRRFQGSILLQRGREEIAQCTAGGQVHDAAECRHYVPANQDQVTGRP